MGQLLSFVAADHQECIDDFILSFELKEKEFRKYVDVLDYSIIANDFNNWNEDAQEMWVSEKNAWEND